MMKVAIVLRSTEHQPVSTTIVSYMACVSGLVSGEHVLDAVVAVAFVQPLDRAVFIDVAVLWQACPGCCCCSCCRSALGSCCFY